MRRKREYFALQLLRRMHTNSSYADGLKNKACPFLNMQSHNREATDTPRRRSVAASQGMKVIVLIKLKVSQDVLTLRMIN